MKNIFKRLFLAGFLLLMRDAMGETQSHLLYQLPFKIKSDLVCIQVSINGQGPFIASIDTGTNTIVVGDSLADKLGLKKVPNGNAAGVGNARVEQFLATGLVLEVGNRTESNVDASILRLPAKLPCQVVLGYDFLQNKVLQIDYPNHVIRVFDDLPFAKTVDLTERKKILLSFELVNKVPKIKGLDIGGKKVEAVLDTGGSYGLLFFSMDALRRAGVDRALDKAVLAHGQGYAGSEPIKAVEVKDVALGDFPRGRVQAGIIQNEKLQMNFGSGVCAIGEEFMKSYVVTFDYKDRLVSFEKTP